MYMGCCCSKREEPKEKIYYPNPPALAYQTSYINHPQSQTMPSRKIEEHYYPYISTSVPANVARVPPVPTSVLSNVARVPPVPVPPVPVSQQIIYSQRPPPYNPEYR